MKHTSSNTMAEPSKKKVTFKHFLVVQHPVKSYEEWQPAFDAHESVRKQYGLTVLSVGRGLENSDMIFILMAAEDLKKAKEFTQSPNLKEIMQKAGVMATPIISFMNNVRSDFSAIPQKERIFLTHHVKKFETWLKVFDAEGQDTRAAHGMIDRGLARDAEDPNRLYLLFAVGDMKKIQARIKSPELKKIMADAGVEVAPIVHTFKLED